MRFSPTQFGLALLTVVVWPILGGSNQVRAGVILNNALELPPLFGPMEDSPTWGMTLSRSEEQPNGASPSQPSEGSSPSSPRTEYSILVCYSLWTFSLGESAGTSSSTSGVSGVGVSGLQMTLNEPVDLLSQQADGRLYHDFVKSRPPPFPSRVYRPPRLS